MTKIRDSVYPAAKIDVFFMPLAVKGFNRKEHKDSRKVRKDIIKPI